MADGRHDAGANRLSQAVAVSRFWKYTVNEPIARSSRYTCPMSIDRSVRYNCRRLEKRNVNEDSDTLYRLRYDCCRIAGRLHGCHQELGRM
jgi:hypothetical protein